MAGLLLSAAGSAWSGEVSLLPRYASGYQVAGGADATFVQLAPGWHQSTVLWDEATQQFGSGKAVSTYAWGDGLWGLADWQTIQAMAQAAAGSPVPEIAQVWHGAVSGINFGDAEYNLDYALQWGPANLPPFFTAADAALTQDNWTSHFSGYFEVEEAGAYDFSVLNDDGFFLYLTGADDARLTIGRDFLNPRERIGFADQLLLSPGVYGFELGSWDHLETGVVDLRWILPGATTWTLVPTGALVPVPEPASGLLLAVGGLLSAAAMHRRRARPGLRA